MKKKFLPLLVASVAITSCIYTVTAKAETSHTLYAYSRTALAITGNVIIGERSIRFANRKKLPWKMIAQENNVTIFEVLSKATPVLLNGNQLCGKDPTQHIVMEKNVDHISLAVFDTPLPKPFDTADPKKGACATYTYVENLSVLPAANSHKKSP